MDHPDLGVYLKSARESRGLSQLQAAKVLRLKSGQCISDWERNKGSTIPVPALKKLIQLILFEVLLNHQLARLQLKVTQDFYGDGSVTARKRSRA